MSTFYLLLALGLAVGALIWAAQRWGRAAAEKDFHAKGSENAKKALEIDEHVDGMSAADLDKRLRGDE